MGIGATVKNIFSDNQPSPHDDAHAPEQNRAIQGDEYLDDNSGSPSNPDSKSYKLPPGSGPGTSGKLQSGATAHDLDRSNVGRGASVHDTSANVGISSSNRNRGYISPGIAGTQGNQYSRTDRADIMPTGNVLEDSKQLAPVTHKHVRHVEIEEVERVKEHESHVHHVQHHMQPVTVTEEAAEQHRHVTHPVTHIREKHANLPDDSAFLEGQVRQHRDIVHHGDKERHIVDKGTTINEHTHHHIHHVIQPVIDKEVIQKERIHTTIPIHEVIHKAPVVHQSQTHSPISIEHFLERGGVLSGGATHDTIGRELLHGDGHVREVDGIAESLEKDLRLGSGNHHKVVTGAQTQSVRKEPHNQFSENTVEATTPASRN